MEQSKMFGEAKWVCAGDYGGHTSETLHPAGLPHFPILRSAFECERQGLQKAVLRVLGLGFFHCYVNGKEITQDQFLPLNTDYEPRADYPIHEALAGHRIYVPEYDVTDFLNEGKNVIAIHFGGGWYTFNSNDGWMPGHDSRFGCPKAIFRLVLEGPEGVREIVSSCRDRMGDSFVKTYRLTSFEAQDYTDFDDAVFLAGYDDSGWSFAREARALRTDYSVCDCPADRVDKSFHPVCIRDCGAKRVYDCGQNLSGYPVLRVKAPKGACIRVAFSEERQEDGSLHPDYVFGQSYQVVSDGRERTVWPRFTWFAFRYFSVEGNAQVESVAFVHADIRVTGCFSCDNELLNWLYDTFIHTQLCNMHAGIPSDCPHIERRGYTGDGQLACHAVMNVLDARSFYRKWIGDISDCQDIYTGHVQNTAPYTRCGGGPGGWGGAIVEVPYQYYRHYGDSEPLARLYPQMLRYFDYLDSCSCEGFVVRDKEGEWCLGDWCAPTEEVLLPTQFVNTWFYIKLLGRMKEIAEAVGRGCDISGFDRKLEALKGSFDAAYYSAHSHSFIGGIQGADAFAIDIGLGAEETYGKLREHYEKLGHLDTGIFGTDVVIRVLFEHGDGDLAVRLLSSSAPATFAGMRRAGATTLWESWPDSQCCDRSHNHPMFGAVAAYLSDYLLGIRQEDGKAGYRDIVIAPVPVDSLKRVSGRRGLPQGDVSVSWEKADGKVRFSIQIPDGTQAVLRFGGDNLALHTGENLLEMPYKAQ